MERCLRAIPQEEDGAVAELLCRAVGAAGQVTHDLGLSDYFPDMAFLLGLFQEWRVSLHTFMLLANADLEDLFEDPQLQDTVAAGVQNVIRGMLADEEHDPLSLTSRYVSIAYFQMSSLPSFPLQLLPDILKLLAQQVRVGEWASNHQPLGEQRPVSGAGMCAACSMCLADSLRNTKHSLLPPSGHQ